ncbi:hypothetical protein [Rhodopila sp.]|uniref:hypothetical protein n=1 Tax=Rhodopila sp. TaxID=2480087 RepID=UPI003D0D79CA
MKRRRLVLTGLLGMLLGACITLIVTAFLLASAPLQITQIRPFVVTRARGSTLELHYKFLSRRQCNSVIATWLWTWVDNDGLAPRQRYFVPISTVFVTLADPSPLLQEFIIARHLPDEVTPGQWFLRAKYLDRCGFLAGLFDPEVRESPDMPVIVPERTSERGSEATPRRPNGHASNDSAEAPP